MRFALLICALAFTASCSQPAPINWLETARLVEGAPVIEAAPAEGEAAPPVTTTTPAATHAFLIGEGPAPEGVTLNVWAFKIEGADGDVGAFRAAVPSEPNFTAELLVDGARMPLMQLVRQHAIENPLIGLYTALPETRTEWIPCSGRPLSHAVLVYHPFRADLALTVLGFADGAPGEENAIYCGARAFHIPQ
jgi:hypothetical protein